MGSLFLKIYQKTIFKKPRFGHFEPNQRKLDSLRFKDCTFFQLLIKVLRILKAQFLRRLTVIHYRYTCMTYEQAM